MFFSLSACLGGELPSRQVLSTPHSLSYTSISSELAGGRVSASASAPPAPGRGSLGARFARRLPTEIAEICRAPAANSQLSAIFVD